MGGYINGVNLGGSLADYGRFILKDRTTVTKTGSYSGVQIPIPTFESGKGGEF